MPSKYLRETSVPLFTKIPAFPNAFPYNELLLDGKLICKTRNWVWNHRGLTLLYTSTRAEGPVASAHGFDIKGRAKKILVGVGNLVDVRALKKPELLKLLGQFNNLSPAQVRKRFDVVRLARKPDCFAIDDKTWDGGDFRPFVAPLDIGFFFEDLKRFKEPVPFNWPTGPVKPIGVDVGVVAEALRAIGILPVDVPSLIRQAA